MTRASTTKLLVLGVLKMYERAHGYQVRQELLSWSADTWANVRQGSIYHALKKLNSEGLLANEHTERGDAGPDRTVFRLTEQGEAEFNLMLRRALTELDSGITLSATIPFLPFLRRAELIDYLQHRRVATRAQLETTQHLVRNNDSMGKPPHLIELFRMWQSGIEGDLRWLDALIGRLEAGEYTFAGEQGE